MTDRPDLNELAKQVHQEADHKSELKILGSIMRREGIKPQIFKY